jgi:ABC-type glycerol-3-phosphate transport system permease component
VIGLVPLLLGSAWLVAVTVTVCCAVIPAGAVYMPEVEIFSTAGLIDQPTAVALVLVTVAARPNN